MKPSSQSTDRSERHPSFEVADIFRTFGPAYRVTHPLSIEQLHTMRDIERCRTAALGGHVDICEKGCGHYTISYNSCRNRHCPKCQSLQGLKWLQQRLQRLLPTPYFHLVATVPHELSPLVLYNKKLLYHLLFRSIAQALLDYAQSWHRLGAQIGFTAVLHTWNQDLLFHPHLHIIATGGGLDPSGARWIASRQNFLVPVKALSVKIRELFCDSLLELFSQGKMVFPQSLAHLQKPPAFCRFLKKRRHQKWVVYCKKPFAGPEQFLRYISRYTHRVAISNPRILDFSNGRVVFKARDNRNPGAHRTVILPAAEFIRRFLLHVLPTGFVKIRHYGLLAPCNAKTKLQQARSLLAEKGTGNPVTAAGDRQPSPANNWCDRLLHLTGIDLTLCPRCGARMVRKPLATLAALTHQTEVMAMNSS